MGVSLQHKTIYTGGPCERCGLRYSPSTSYVPCFEPGDSLKKWMSRNGFILKNGSLEFVGHDK